MREMMSTQTLMILLICFLGASLGAVAILSIVLNYKNQTRLTRIFGEKQGIPIASMEGKPAPKEMVMPVVKPKKVLFSMPVPGMQSLREMYQAQAEKNGGKGK